MINKNKPLISIIIPTFNAEKFIEKTIYSVLNQTYKNFELLIIDDSSTDSTLSIIKRLEQTDKRIILHTVPYTGNPANNRNFGIQKAKGTLIAFLDHDDMWVKNKLEDQVKLFNANPSSSLIYSVSKAFGDVNIFSPNYEILPLPFKASYNRKDLLTKGNSITTSSVIVKKELLEEIGGFDENVGVMDDYDMWIRLSKKGALAFIPKIHVLYRVHDKQASSSWEVKKERLEHFSAQKNLDLPKYNFYRNRGIAFLAARNLVHLLSYFYYVLLGGFLFKRLLRRSSRVDKSFVN